MVQMSVAINKIKTSQTDFKALISMTSAMAAGATCALVGGLTVLDSGKKTNSFRQYKLWLRKGLWCE
jgi:hypothetical protein